MLYFLILIGFLLIGTTLYLRKHVLLPAPVNQIIEEIKEKGVPEYVPGQTGIAKNKEVSIFYEVQCTHPNPKGNVLLLNGHSQTILDYPRHFYQGFLNAGYQIIRMDNRGLGMTDWIEDWTKENAFTLEDMAEDAIAVLNTLNIKKTHLVGFSMGGMIAQTIAIYYPNRILSLTSMMTSGFYYDKQLTAIPKNFIADFLLVNLIYGNHKGVLENKIKLHLAINRITKGIGYTFDDTEVLQKAYYENTRRKGYNKASADKQTHAIMASGSRYDKLKKLNVPTLVIHGTQDPLVLLEHGKKYARMIPNAKTLFIEGLGHHFPKEHTATMTTEILKLWQEMEA